MTQVIHNYIIEKKIGVGSYGVVYKAKRKTDGGVFVLKQISLFGLSQNEIDDVKNEASLLSQINSPFVVKYYESFEDKNSLYIVMEYCPDGDLSSFLDKFDKQRKPLQEDFIWKMILKIAIGLGAIHKENILHRDLKSLNIFLKKELQQKEFQPKIGDLGVARKLNKNSLAKTFIGTPYYLSPEICEERPYNDKSDVWALGCILYELCTYKHPFNAKTQASLIMKILKGKYDPIRSCYSKDLKDLISMMLTKNDYMRPNVYQIFKKPFVFLKAKEFNFVKYITDLYPDIDKVKLSRPVIPKGVSPSVNKDLRRQLREGNREGKLSGNIPSFSNNLNGNNSKQDVLDGAGKKKVPNKNVQYNSKNRKVNIVKPIKITGEKISGVKKEIDEYSKGYEIPGGQKVGSKIFENMDASQFMRELDKGNLVLPKNDDKTKSKINICSESGEEAVKKYLENNNPKEKVEEKKKIIKKKVIIKNEPKKIEEKNKIEVRKAPRKEPQVNNSDSFEDNFDIIENTSDEIDVNKRKFSDDSCSNNDSDEKVLEVKYTEEDNDELETNIEESSASEVKEKYSITQKKKMKEEIQKFEKEYEEKMKTFKAELVKIIGEKDTADFFALYKLFPGEDDEIGKKIEDLIEKRHPDKIEEFNKIYLLIISNDVKRDSNKKDWEALEKEN